MPDLFPPTIDDPLRREVYGRRVAQGSMASTTADREISAMTAVQETLLLVKRMGARFHVESDDSQMGAGQPA